MKQVEDIKDGRGVDGMIFLSEFYSDNKVKTTRKRWTYKNFVRK